jgi:hypothetical protein
LACPGLGTRGGGAWRPRTLVPSGLRAVVVPSGSWPPSSPTGGSRCGGGRSSTARRRARVAVRHHVASVACGRHPPHCGRVRLRFVIVHVHGGRVPTRVGARRVDEPDPVTHRHRPGVSARPARGPPGAGRGAGRPFSGGAVRGPGRAPVAAPDWTARPAMMVSLDSNAAETALRLPVVTRKNAGGSRNEDGGRLAAVAASGVEVGSQVGEHVQPGQFGGGGGGGGPDADGEPGVGSSRWAASPSHSRLA